MGNLSPYHPTSLSKLLSWATQPVSLCIADQMFYLLRFGGTKNKTEDEFAQIMRFNIGKNLRVMFAGSGAQIILSKLFLSPKKYSDFGLLIANF